MFRMILFFDFPLGLRVCECVSVVGFLEMGNPIACIG